MKATYQIVGSQQFEYIMVENEVENHGQAVECYNDLKHAFVGSNLPVGEGLDQKTWNRVLEEYLNTGSVVDGTNLYEQMSTIQKTVMQEIKKCFKRMKAHLPEEIKE